MSVFPVGNGLKNRIFSRLLQVKSFKLRHDERGTTSAFVSKDKNGSYSINMKIFFSPLKRNR